jgi:hypothetical protein
LGEKPVSILPASKVVPATGISLGICHLQNGFYLNRHKIWIKISEYSRDAALSSVFSTELSHAMKRYQVNSAVRHDQTTYPLKKRGQFSLMPSDRTGLRG